MSDAGRFTPEQMVRRAQMKAALEVFNTQLRDLKADIRDLRFRVYTKQSKSEQLKEALDAKELEADSIKANIERIHSELGNMPRVKSMPERFMTCAEMLLDAEKFQEILALAIVEE